MSKPNLLYYSMLKYQKVNLSMINDSFEVTILENPSQDTDEILSKMDVILAPMGYFLGRDKIDRCPRLKVIGSNTTGHPHIDVDYACEKGIHVVTLKNEKDFLNTITPTAEHTWGLLIALTRHIVPAFRSVLEGKWDRRPFSGKKMLSRMEIGIAGLGRLGFKVAEYALAFGMEVAYYDPFVSCGLPGLVKCNTLEELVERSDIVTVHIPHEKETENLFSESVFSKFKDGAFFINTSRGELVDHNALLSMLFSGRISGAAMDVFEGEFVPGFQDGVKEHPLLVYAKQHDNLLITPHIGGSTIDAWSETEGHTIKQILNLIKKGTGFDSLKIQPGESWALIPARGGSKSIPLKNMVELNGLPLIKYAIDAGKSTNFVQRVICSTDSPEIKSYCLEQGIEVQPRPEDLAQDNVTTIEVILYFLKEFIKSNPALPEFLVLLEPTSPFVIKKDIEACIAALKADHQADSAQTVTRVSSNSHAYNQRYHDENGSHFLFMKERRVCINKQTKPSFFIHGNVRVMRVSSLMATGNLFGSKSIPIPINRLRAMDVDGPDDLIVAESIITSGLLNEWKIGTRK